MVRRPSPTERQRGPEQRGADDRERIFEEVVEHERGHERGEKTARRASDSEPPVELGQVSSAGAIGGELAVAEQGDEEESAEVQESQKPQRTSASQQDHPQQWQRIEREQPVEPVARDERPASEDDGEGEQESARGMTQRRGRMTVK